VLRLLKIIAGMMMRKKRGRRRMTDRNFDKDLSPYQHDQGSKSVGKDATPQPQPSVAFLRPYEFPSGVLLEALEELRSVPKEP